jgi:hypothetical protein
MVKNNDYFFCCCESCGSIDWIEYVKDASHQRKGRVNHLTKEGKQQYPWKIAIQLYETFSKMNVPQKQFQRKWISYDYEDLICSECENILHPIPFNEIDVKQRINIFNMKPDGRKDFANSYRMVKALERN